MEKRFEKFRQNTQENKIVYLENYKRKKAFEVTYNGEKSRGFGKIHTKKCNLGKIQWPKITFGAKCNGESVEVSAKYIPKKCILGKIQWRKIAFGVRYNGEKLKSLGKIHRKTKSFIWKNIREKRHLR